MKQFLETTWPEILKWAAAAGGLIAGLFGGWSLSLTVLVGCMGVDYASGLIVAVMGKSRKTEGGGLDSNVGLRGLLRKGMILLVVLVASLLDRVIGGDGWMCREAACWFYIANEGLSILENSSLAGVPWPASVKKVLEQMKAKEDEKPPDEAA